MHASHVPNSYLIVWTLANPNLPAPLSSLARKRVYVHTDVRVSLVHCSLFMCSTVNSGYIARSSPHYYRHARLCFTRRQLTQQSPRRLSHVQQRSAAQHSAEKHSKPEAQRAGAEAEAETETGAKARGARRRRRRAGQAVVLAG